MTPGKFVRQATPKITPEAVGHGVMNTAGVGGLLVLAVTMGWIGPNDQSEMVADKLASVAATLATVASVQQQRGEVIAVLVRDVDEVKASRLTPEDGERLRREILDDVQARITGRIDEMIVRVDSRMASVDDNIRDIEKFLRELLLTREIAPRPQ